MKNKTEAQHAYDDWKSQFRVNMVVFTDEQMFCIGYESRDEYVKDLEAVVKDLDKELTKYKKAAIKSKEKPSVKPK